MDESIDEQGAIRLNNKPYAMVIDTNRNLLYVTHRNSNTISVVNASTNAVTQTIDSGGMNPFGIAINPENNKLYVANFESDSVSVVDAETGKILANVTNVNYHPYKIAINPVTDLVYVASIGSTRTLNVIDGDADKVIYNITIARGDSNGIALNPNTNIAYVTHDFSNFVSVVDVSPSRIDYEGRIVEVSQVGDRVFDVAVNPVTNIFYGAGSGGISAVEGETNRAIANITMNPYPGGGVAVNEETNEIYVANGWINTTTLVDGSTNRITDVIEIGDGADAVAINPYTNLVYVANHLNSISVLNGLTKRIVPEFGSSIILVVVAAMMIVTVIASIAFVRRMEAR